MFNYLSDQVHVKEGGGAAGKEALAAMLRVLGDPTRLSIFDMLMEGVQCNCEIAERLDLSLSLISHHLAVLRRAGLVRSERDPEDARWVYYSIDLPALDALRREMGWLLDSQRIKPRLPSCGPKGCVDGSCGRAGD